MHKIILMPLAFLAFGFVAGAQTSDKIEKAAKDPATKERAEKADALLIDRKKIVPADENVKQVQPAASKKSRRCTKSRN